LSNRFLDRKLKGFKGFFDENRFFNLKGLTQKRDSSLNLPDVSNVSVLVKTTWTLSGIIGN